MSTAEPSSSPIVPAAPAVSLRFRIVQSVLLLGLLGCAVGVIEGVLIGMVLMKSGVDSSWLTSIIADRALAFGVLGVLLGMVGGTIRWLLRDRRKTTR